MKKYLFLFAAFIISISLFSQPCFPDGITFSTQDEIDSLNYYYPDCTDIGGNVVIRGDNILSIDSLIFITSIGGDLQIIYNVNLENINGLASLTYLGGSLEISNNNSLVSFTGLEGLQEIFGNCVINYNVPGIADMQGLNGIKAIHGDLSIRNNYYLEDLLGLDSLLSVGGDLNVSNTDRLNNLSGIDQLSSIGESCVLQENKSLKNLDAFSSLSSIGNQLALIYNDSLANIEGLTNIDAGTIAELYIEANNMLSECAVKSICDYLVSPNGNTSISQNAEGCNDVEEVKTDCGITSTEGINVSDQFTLFPNPASNHVLIKSNLKIRLVKVFSVSGKLMISESPDFEHHSLNTSSLSHGIYNLLIHTDTDIYSERLIIK